MLKGKRYKHCIVMDRPRYIRNKYRYSNKYIRNKWKRNEDDDFVIKSSHCNSVKLNDYNLVGWKKKRWWRKETRKILKIVSKVDQRSWYFIFCFFVCMSVALVRPANRKRGSEPNTTKKKLWTNLRHSEIFGQLHARRHNTIAWYFVCWSTCGRVI